MPIELRQAQPLVEWINERHAIYMRKEFREGRVPSHIQLLHDGPGYDLNDFRLPDDAPLTDDPVLREFRFCNVFRELDRVTAWIRENIREPFADHEHLWFMLAIARFINWPPTLQHLQLEPAAWPSHRNFSPALMGAALERLRCPGRKIETGAYMIRAESDPNKEWYSWSKQRYVSEIVLGRPWRDRGNVRNFLQSRFMDQPPTLERAWEVLTQKVNNWVGWGPFMAHQVVVDLRWTRYLENAPDVGKWAAIGPGSARGLNRLVGRPLKQAVSQERALDEMRELSELIHQPGVLDPWVPPIELSDLQNCLCETDKWLRAHSGEGRPRSKYVPGRGS